jgi:hypothetical protein
MKAIPCIVAPFVACAWADEAAERTAIEGVIGALNDAQPGTSARSSLFTADAENELDRRSQPSDRPWSEVTRPRLVIQAIRFVTPEVALVNAASTQYGSTTPVRRIPVLLVMKKEANWRIASLRLLAPMAPSKP